MRKEITLKFGIEAKSEDDIEEIIDSIISYACERREVEIWSKLNETSIGEDGKPYKQVTSLGDFSGLWEDRTK